jgi:hypothetical protein
VEIIVPFRVNNGNVATAAVVVVEAPQDVARRDIALSG